jgi:hypothetical protein
VSRIIAASDRKAEAAAVLTGFLAKWRHRNEANNTIIKYTSVFCDALKAAGVENTDLPFLPRSFNDKRRKRCLERIVEKQETPIVIRDYAGFMGVVCMGLRAAIDAKQCPEVLILLSFIIPFRSNDQNKAHVRANGTTCDSTSHRIIHGAMTRDGRKVASAIVNSHPSKANCRSFNYATVPLCDPEFYGLVYEAMAFVHNPEITALKCTTCVADYKKGVPSGPPKGQEWGSPYKGIMKHMLTKLGLCSYVSNWGTYMPGTLYGSMGRAFCASSIEQGRFRFDAPLTNTKALKNSTQNAPYLCFCCSEPPKVPGVRLRKVTAADPLYLDGGAVVITEGVCLVDDQARPLSSQIYFFELLAIVTGFLGYVIYSKLYITGGAGI